MTTETCTVRPELIEFDKTQGVTSGDKQYLTIVAHPDGFKFTETAKATNDAGNIENSGDITYEGNLADMYAKKMNLHTLDVEDIEEVETMTMKNGDSVLNMNDGEISNVGTLTTYVDPLNPERAISIHTNVIEMNQTGIMANTSEINFYNGTGTGLTLTNDSIVMGEPGGHLDMRDGAVSNVDTLTLFNTDSSINVSGGTVSAVQTLTMSDLGLHEFPGGGLLDMSHVDCVANIGDLTISGSVIENRSGFVQVELTKFAGNVITTSEIDALDGTTVTVMGSKFTDGNFEVLRVNTNTVHAIANVNNPLEPVNLKLSSNDVYGATGVCEKGVIDVTEHRVSNVQEPVAGSDAATKNYVNEAVSMNIQGLKPKKACDYGIFADAWDARNNTTVASYNQGFAVGSDKDRDVTAPAAGDDYRYFLTMQPIFDNATQTDRSILELFFNLNDTNPNANVTFGGYVVQDTYETLNAANVTEMDPCMPNIPRKRILINGINASNYRPDLHTDVSNNERNLIPANDANVAGLNGVWEVVTYDSQHVQYNAHYYNRLTLVRADDMNENKEMMNNAYTYLMNGVGGKALADYGYVVNNKDPITISGGSGYTDLSDGNVGAVEWVQFNQVNFEMDFLTPNPFGTQSKRVEELPLNDPSFNKGGLLMRYAPGQPGEKQVMLDHKLLNYDAISDDIDKTLTVRGNMTLLEANVTNGMSKLDVVRDTAVNGSTIGILNANGMKISSVSGAVTVEADDIICNTVTCESDKSLKKNIETMVRGLDLIARLKPVTYNWNTDAECKSVEYGFIAQDVKEEFPSLVRLNQASGILSVDYMKITSMLASGVQDLHKELQELKAKISSSS